MLGALNVGRTREDAFAADVELLNQVAQQIAIAVENGLAYREIAELKEKLNKKLYLEDELRTNYNFEEIIGESAASGEALHQVEIVAPTVRPSSSERNGDGEELIARAIHNQAGAGLAFVKLNCFAAHSTELESELFGHAKGAFTGAIGRRSAASSWRTVARCSGRVGDHSSRAAIEFLRVLQEQEFRAAGRHTRIRVDVRLCGRHEPQPPREWFPSASSG